MSLYRDYESADAFSAGVVGQPGARTFFLQIGDTSEVLSIKCEKQQIAALAAFIRKTLDDAPAVSASTLREPQFVEPRDAAFALGSVGLAYDRRENQIVLQYLHVPQLFHLRYKTF